MPIKFEFEYKGMKYRGNITLRSSPYLRRKEITVSQIYLEEWNKTDEEWQRVYIDLFYSNYDFLTLFFDNVPRKIMFENEEVGPRGLIAKYIREDLKERISNNIYHMTEFLQFNMFKILQTVKDYQKEYKEWYKEDPPQKPISLDMEEIQTLQENRGFLPEEYSIILDFYFAYKQLGKYADEPLDYELYKKYFKF